MALTESEMKLSEAEDNSIRRKKNERGGQVSSVALINMTHRVSFVERERARRVLFQATSTKMKTKKKRKNLRAPSFSFFFRWVRLFCFLSLCTYRSQHTCLTRVTERDRERSTFYSRILLNYIIRPVSLLRLSCNRSAQSCWPSFSSSAQAGAKKELQRKREGERQAENGREER